MLVHGGVQDVEQPLVSQLGVTSTEDWLEVNITEGSPEVKEAGRGQTFLTVYLAVRWLGVLLMGYKTEHL